MAKPFYVFLALNIIAVGFGVYRLFVFPAERFATVITMSWAFFNIFILLAAMGVLLERRQRRATARMPSEILARVKLGDKSYEAVIRDLSVHGANLELDAAYESAFRPDTHAAFEVEGSEPLEGKPFHFVVKNSRPGANGMAFLGVQFQHEDLEEMKRKVYLVLGNSDRWMDFQTNREKRLGITRSAIFLFTCGIRFSIEHFAHLVLESNTKRNVPAYQGGGSH